MCRFVHRFDYPGVVAVSPFPGALWMDDLLGNPVLPGLQPLAVRPFPQPMSLAQRAATTALYLYSRYLRWRSIPLMEKAMRR